MADSYGALGYFADPFVHQEGTEPGETSAPNQLSH